MVALCRHIMPSNSHCGSPALKGHDFCFNHQLVKRTTRRAPRSPNDFTYVIPFVYPEDRAAINHNLYLVLQAQAEHKIDTRTANSMTANLRAAASNLNRGPLLEENRANAVQRVILTPEGDEIAPPREVLEEGESAPIHHKNCPCQRCAEEFRNAPPEQHHANCKCGLCDEPTNTGAGTGAEAVAPHLAEMWDGSEPASVLSDQTAGTGDENGCPILDAPSAARVGGDGLSDQARPQLSTNGCHPERSEGSAVSPPATNEGGAKRVCLGACPEQRRRGQSRTAPAPKLHSCELTTNSVTEEEKFFNDIYREHIEKHKAQHDARAHAAVEAGLEPPPYEPFDPKKIEPKAERLYKETMAQVEKNREAARLSWNRLHPDRPVEYTPYVSWADEEELRREQWKKAREEEAERSRAAASQLTANS